MYTGHILPKQPHTSCTYSQLLTVCDYKDSPHKWRPEYELNTLYIWTVLPVKLLLVEKILDFISWISESTILLL